MRDTEHKHNSSNLAISTRTSEFFNLSLRVIRHSTRHRIDIMNVACAHVYGLCAAQRGFPCEYGAPITTLSYYLRKPLSAKEAEELKKAQAAEYALAMQEIEEEEIEDPTPHTQLEELVDVTPMQIKMGQKK